MTTYERIHVLAQLGKYMQAFSSEWHQVQRMAASKNPWFTEESIHTAVQHISENFLHEDKLEQWLKHYHLARSSKTVGIVMAGNIPLVGFHDFLCGYTSNHFLQLKTSSKDDVLLPHLIKKLTEFLPETAKQVQVVEKLKNCDAYIATGSNNSARYFEQYFGKQPHIIRRNRTSVAILEGDESRADLEALAKDVFTYFGLGCRNVTQLCVPEGYDFSHLLEVFRQHEDLMLFHKYKNNYDFHLAVYLLNKVPYLTNGCVLLVENPLPFSAVSVLHYRFYRDRSLLAKEMEESDDIQTIVGKSFVPFGKAQSPELDDYADGLDTMAFLCGLSD